MFKQHEANRTNLSGEEHVETFQLEHTDPGDSSRVVSMNRFFMSAWSWATDSRCWAMAFVQKTDGMLQNVRSQNVRHFVFPVSVITRCLRPIVGWKGLGPRLCAVRHTVAHITLIFQTESRCTCPAQSILLNFKITLSVGRSIGAEPFCALSLCHPSLSVRVSSRCFPESCRSDFTARWEAWMILCHRMSALMWNWQPASSCSTGIGSNLPQPCKG